MGNDQWTRVTVRRPCPICKKSDWCGISFDGRLAICMRTESKKRSKNGGFVHRLDDDQAVAPLPRPVRSKGPVRRVPWRATMLACVDEIMRVQLKDLADAFGCPIGTLERMQVGWSCSNDAYTIPMRDADGEPIGIQLRYRNGRKLCIKGSHLGLFGTQCQNAEPVIVTEGASDCAYVMAMGFHAIGRPSNVSGHELVAEYLGRMDKPDVVVICDRDKEGSPAAAATKRGAQQLAKSVRRQCRTLKIVKPPADKDVRAWAPSKAAFEAVVKNARLTT